MSSGQPIPHGGYHHQTASDPFRSSVYPAAPRLLSGSSTSTIMPPPPPPSYMYPSPPRLVNAYPPSHYNINNPQAPINEYFVGHVLSGANTPYPNYTAVPPESNYTCIGAPVGVEHGFGHANRGGGGSGGGRDMMASSSVQDNNNNDKEEEFGGMNMNMNVNRGRSYGAASGTVTQQRLDSSSLINRYQDHGF